VSARWTADQIADIERMAAAGYPVKTVASKYGRSLATIGHLSMKHDIDWAVLPKSGRATLPEMVGVASWTAAALDRAKDQLRREIAAAVRERATAEPYRGHNEDFA
jgi:hypothetical protein